MIVKIDHLRSLRAALRYSSLCCVYANFSGVFNTFLGNAIIHYHVNIINAIVFVSASAGSEDS